MRFTLPACVRELSGVFARGKAESLVWDLGLGKLPLDEEFLQVCVVWKIERR